MALEFKKLKGNRIYVTIPKKEESKLVVDENTKEALNRELLAKMSKLTVYAVGDGISDVEEGDVILVDPSKLSTALLIPLTEDKTVMLISYFDVIHIW
jgi:ABC-type Na+ efflux pump permease subunit